MQERIGLNILIKCELLFNTHLHCVICLQQFNGNTSTYFFKVEKEITDHLSRSFPHSTIIYKIYYFVISFRYTDQVSVGDEVLVDENNKLIPAKVIRVASTFMQGASFV